jgi:hypothetical protein
MDTKIEEKKGKFLEGLQAKHNTKVEDADAMKPKGIKVEGLLNDMNSFPEKIHIAGPIGETSVRKSKPQENDLHGKDGQPMAGNK